MRAVLALAFAGAIAADPATTTAATTVVRVDVLPADARGRIVETLKPTDFELLENGVAQKLDEATLVKIDGKAGANESQEPIRSEQDEQSAAARDDTRLFAIFLDEYHVSAGVETTRVREALTRFVDRDLGPRDLIIVMKPLDSLLTIRLTRDQEAARRIIGSFEGRKGDYTPRSDFERTYVAGTHARVDEMRSQVATSALNALATHLGVLSDRRKAIVFVSEGFARTARRRGLEPLPTVDSVIRAANRHNVSIYTVNPEDPGDSADGGAEAGSNEAAAETLRTLAEATDGRAFMNSPTADDALRRIVSDCSAYYLLTYRSEHPDDGRFREVQIKVRKPGITVRARKGYWAPSPDEAIAAATIARFNSTESRPVEMEPAWHVSALIKPWFGLARGIDGRTRVTFVWEPTGRPPGDRSRRTEPFRIKLKALGSDGSSVFEGEVRPVTAGMAEGEQPGASRAVFEVPPGRLRLRMSIEDAGAKTIDSDVREIAIRDLRAPVALGTAEILRTRNAREFNALEGDPSAVPVASREFSRTERLLVRFDSYVPSGATPQLSAKLLSRAGQNMRELSIRPLSTSDPRHQIDLPLAGLAPGEYLIELSVTCPAGQAKDLINFRVTS